MTTIVYDAKKHQIAVDSRATANGLIVTDECQKWHITDDFVFFLAGAVHEIELVHQYYPNIQFEGSSSCQGFVYERATNRLYSVGWHEGRQINNHITYNFAFGSGMHYALAALDMGRTAKSAVEAAFKRDTGSGGKINVFDLEKFHTPDDSEPMSLKEGEVVIIQGDSGAEYRGKRKQK